MTLTLYTDGACSGNPGPAGIGYVVLNEQGDELTAVSEAIGRTTNNVAEYTALIRGLQTCRELGATTVQVVSDSQLMVRQMLGQYRVKDATLQELHRQAKDCAAGFERVRYRHVLRGENSRADGLASGAIRSKP